MNINENTDLIGFIVWLICSCNLGNKSIRQYLSQFSLKNRQKVEIVVMDMNAGYQAPIRELFPNAIIVVDRFHIVQLAMKAVQSERIKIQRELSDKNHNRVYKLLKSNWKFFLKAERNIDTSIQSGFVV
ncbi:transposase [Paucilactobacillus nenjiangensis]|uniref:transposase n=1 Tax=Paucilactobacillus nenjiangensis TaxID=1296540 RepID=UPI0010F595C8|nr:transposase [Paucilactobacillus nenjiangensis]